MGVALVVAGVFQAFLDVLEIGNVVIVDLGQKALVGQTLHAVFGREHHVESAGIGFHLHQHVLVGGKAHVVDVNAGFGFEVLQHGLVDIVFPVEHVHHFLRQSTGGKQQGDTEQKGNHFFHVGFLLSYFLTGQSLSKEKPSGPS